MNILIAATHITRANGGVSTHIVDLCNGLLMQGCKVYVTSAGGEYLKKIEDLGIEHYTLPFIGIQKHPIKMFKVFMRLKKIIKEHKIDIVHIHGQSLILFLQIIRKIYKIPFVWTNHIDAVAQPKLFKKLYAFSNFPIISVSIDLKKYLVKNFGIEDENIRVINNGLNAKSYYPLSDKEYKKCCEEFGINKTHTVITLPGRLTYGKGHEYLIAAVSNLMKIYPNKDFVVLFAGGINSAGEKEYLNNMLQLANEKCVLTKYIGFRDLRCVLGITDIMVLPSLYEGFGIVCAEGFLMKTPVVRSDTPGHTDMSDICKVFHKGNIEELVMCICELLNNPEESNKMIERAYKKAKQEYTREFMVNKTLSYYEEIVKYISLKC